MYHSENKLKDKIQKNKFLRNKKSFVFLLILFLGVGFAFLTSNLTITGNTSVSGNKWSVYFTNVQVTEGGVDASVEPTVTGTTTTSLDYTVLLDKPGDFYEFTVEAKNDGTIDAMIDSITKSNIDSRVLQYLNYSVKYLDGTDVKVNDVLSAKKSTTYKIRIEYRTDISASDLDENGVDLNLSFGVKYVQSTIKPKKFAELAKNSALSDSTIDFTNISSNSNGKGLYVRNGTQTNTNPIYYYRGDVDNNNVRFAGFCWKIVRTTETGGTKLIYNGLPSNVYENYEELENNSYINVTNNETYPFVFDVENKEWKNTYQTNSDESVLTFSVDATGDYNLNYKIESTSGWAWGIDAVFYKDGIEIGKYSEMDDNTGSIYLENLSPSSILSIKYKNYSNESSFSFSLEKGIGESVVGCINENGTSTQLSSTSKFNDNSAGLVYNGYMYGSVYGYQTIYNASQSDLYGSSFTYENGNYTLTSTQSGIDDNHHYTCFNQTGICSNVYYVFFVDSSPNSFYITLSNGESVEDAIAEMQTNRNNSTIKTVLESWFSNNFNSYFTSLSKDYSDYLEDTVWCNDRSMNTIDVDGNGTYTNNGWNPNGGSISNYLWYNAYGKIQAGTFSLVCSNKNDSFTVTESSNGNGKLTYPVGLLTSDEVMLAGGGSSTNNSYYLYTGQSWWTMSSRSFDAGAAQIIVQNDGYAGSANVAQIIGVRPSISVKSAIKIATGGDGTSTSPYEFVVE